MQAYTAIMPSGGTAGKPIVIAQTATAGDTIHAYSAAGIDEITIYCNNLSVNDEDLTIELGDATVTHNIKQKIYANSGPQLVLAAHRFNSGTIKAFASTTNVLNIIAEVTNIV